MDKSERVARPPRRGGDRPAGSQPVVLYQARSRQARARVRRQSFRKAVGTHICDPQRHELIGSVVASTPSKAAACRRVHAQVEAAPAVSDVAPVHRHVDAICAGFGVVGRVPRGSCKVAERRVKVGQAEDRPGHQTVKHRRQVATRQRCPYMDTPFEHRRLATT